MNNLISFIANNKKVRICLSIAIGLIFMFALFRMLIPSNYDNRPTSDKHIRITPPKLSPSPNKVLEYASREDVPFEEEGRLIKKETQPNGYTYYYFYSEVENRPNLVVENKDVVIFERQVIQKTNPVKVSEIKYLFGEPDRVIQMRAFYNGSELYIYEEDGFAAVVDKISGDVYEQHFFSPLNVKGYIYQFSYK